MLYTVSLTSVWAAPFTEIRHAMWVSSVEKPPWSMYVPGAGATYWTPALPKHLSAQGTLSREVIRLSGNL